MRFLSPTSYCHKTTQGVGYPFHWQMRDQETAFGHLGLWFCFLGAVLRSQEDPRGSLGQTLGSLCQLDQAAVDPGPGSGPSFKTPGWLLRADARVSVCLNWFPSTLDTFSIVKLIRKDSP